MSWTKREIILGALTEIGMGAYAYDAQPEDLQDALRRLDTLLASLSTTGLDTGAPISLQADGSDLDQPANIAPDLTRGLVCMLACDIAPSYGKQPSGWTMTTAKRTEDLILRKSARIPLARPAPMSVPYGAGHKEPYQIGLVPYTDHAITDEDRE